MFIRVKHTHELSEGARLFLRALAREFTEVFMAKANEVLDEIKAYLDADKVRKDRLSVAVTNLTGDVRVLKDKIAALENSPGDLSPADEEKWQAIRSQFATLATHGDEVTAAAEDLDSQTPPEIPPVEPAPEE